MPVVAAISPWTWITAQVLFSLGAIMIVSCVTFWVLVRRSTAHRQWVALAEWAREANFRFCPTTDLPPPLDAIISYRPIARMCVGKGATLLVQIETTGVAKAASGQAPSGPQIAIWNVLVRHLPAAWRPTGVRPAGAPRSLLDLFSLSSFPLLGSTERFVVYGTDSAAARELSLSMARSLLPPDIGLLLYGTQLVLDFSGRPFDPIEFNRMLALANQLAQKLPTPNGVIP